MTTEEAVRIVREELPGFEPSRLKSAVETVLAALEEVQREAALNRSAAEKHYALAEERGAALEQAQSRLVEMYERIIPEEIAKGLAAHLAAHKTADAHDCAEMEEEYQRVKAERDEARAEIAAMKKHHDEMHEQAEAALAAEEEKREQAEGQCEAVARECIRLQETLDAERGRSLFLGVALRESTAILKDSRLDWKVYVEGMFDRRERSIRKANDLLRGFFGARPEGALAPAQPEAIKHARSAADPDREWDDSTRVCTGCGQPWPCDRAPAQPEEPKMWGYDTETGEEGQP